MRGVPQARIYLSRHEWSRDRNDRAVKHLIIAANLGFDQSLTKLQGFYKCGLVSKEDFTAALRAYQAVVNESKSPQRDEADEIHKRYEKINEYKSKPNYPLFKE